MANQGNPNHAPAGAPGGIGGQFVSGPQAGGETEQEQQQAQAPVKKKATTKGKKKATFKKKAAPTLKSSDALAQMFAKLQDINQSINVPPLSTVKELEDNIEKFFSKQIINHIDSLDGKAQDCSAYQFHPKSNPRVCLNIYTCVFGKYRYPDNHAHYVDDATYQKMAADVNNYSKVYRGISSLGQKRKDILDSYVSNDINNLDIYGNGCYGTNVYTTLSPEYARSYGTPIYGLVDKNARSIFSNTLENMQSSLDTTTIVQKVEAHLINQGLEQNRANQIARHFGQALKNDISLLAILLGYDYQYGDGAYASAKNHHQRNILNLSKWYIRREF